MSKHFASFSVAVAAAATLLAAPAAQAQIKTPAASPQSTITQRVGLTDITIVYSRPSAKGRSIFGSDNSLVPNGKRWRTGANATTSIKFSDDVTIEGKKIPAGEYGIYTVPRPTEWTVVLNKSLKQGADVDGFKDDQDVARFTIKPYKVAGKVETFTIAFTDLTPATANVAMEWENTGAKFNIKADVDSKVMAQIDEKITKAATPAPADLASAAVYYFDNNKDLKQALAWMEKANAAEPTKYWNLNTEAKIRLKMKDYAGATKAAEASKKAALAATPPNGEYVKMNEELMAQAKKMGK
ncbi:DUF2911 domain-containing protein [Hymenobacter terrigena]